MTQQDWPVDDGDLNLLLQGSKAQLMVAKRVLDYVEEAVAKADEQHR